ncbi:hypothetical protein [Acidicapsa acidisoli]|uniref:hypothetical protein n=1 Tax=Acidicapsa acidisoli TaxID=1615681 RepID=UPI0021E0B68F|nr:hypothetical protein [Acidicapsa acidisoli]
MVASDIKHDTGGEIPAPAPVHSRFRLLFYLAPLVLIPILIIVFAILVVPSERFAAHSGDPFLMTLGYGAQLRNADCRITIYGDSTAMIGVNPELIQQRTGLSTCNIGETEGMTMINGTMVLDQFLEHNPAPQFLVFLYAPEDLDPQSQRSNTQVSTFEAVTYRFRQPNKLLSMVALMRHPEDFFSWAIHGARWAMDSVVAKPLPPETKLLRFKTHGQSALKDHTMTPESCANLPRLSPPNRAWVSGLRSKYAVNGTTVLVDSMLLSECDPGLKYYPRELSGVIDNQISALPVPDFYSGGRHVNPIGSVPLSTMIADQINERLQAAQTRGVR